MQEWLNISSGAHFTTITDFNERTATEQLHHFKLVSTQKPTLEVHFVGFIERLPTSQIVIVKVEEHWTIVQALCALLIGMSAVPSGLTNFRLTPSRAQLYQEMTS